MEGRFRKGKMNNIKTKIKGVILAGGSGTRLRPATFVLNKHLLNILNEPMILFPLRTLKSFGIEDILLISGGNHLGGFIEFLGNGSKYGVNLTYRVQEKAGGIAQALGIAEEFIGDNNVIVILGDNIYEDIVYLKDRLNPLLNNKNAHIWLKEVPDAKRFGVCEFKNDKLIKIIEKPNNPPSNWAVTGLYKYPSDVFDFIKTLKPSGRGELEISDVNNWYVKQDRCDCTFIPKDKFWSDAGTIESLAEVTKWALENRQKQQNVS